VLCQSQESGANERQSQKVCESSAAKEKLTYSDEYLLQLDFHNPNVTVFMCLESAFQCLCSYVVTKYLLEVSCETTSLLKLDTSNKFVGPPEATSPWEFKL
jgi:predicted AAA+ superfamily ATPase